MLQHEDDLLAEKTKDSRALIFEKKVKSIGKSKRVSSSVVESSDEELVDDDRDSSDEDVKRLAHSLTFLTKSFLKKFGNKKFRSKIYDKFQSNRRTEDSYRS